MRLIDGNKIVMSLADWWYSSFRYVETEESKAIKKVMEQVEKMVMEMPEIVRCKDCEHSYESSLTEDVEACKEQKSKLESEKVQLSQETSINRVDTSTNTSTDLISRYAAIEEIKNATTITGWNKYASQEEIVDDVERQLRRLFVGAIESLPPVEPPKKVVAQIKVDADELMERIKEEYKIKEQPVCEDAISRADTIKAMCQECKVFPDDEVNCADCTEVAIVKGMPPVEPKRPKATETMMVDGEPIEIDPLSYEVGYTHGQFSK